MSPEEWLASQTQAAPTPAPAPARAQVTDQASKDKEVVQILMQEFKTAQTKSQSGDQRAQEDVKSIARELARKGVTVDLAAAPVAVSATPAPTPAAAPMSPEQWAASQPKMGFFESLAEQVTGRARATPETQALPEWVTMPELNQLSVAGFKTALGTLLSGPKETVQVLQANFPGVQVRQDAKGNYLLKSSVDQKEYAITPGFTMGDIPRALGGLAAFTPAGRAATIPGAIVAAGTTQAAIEATQAATGGEFSPSEVAMAAATGPAGQIIQRVVPPVVQAVKGGLQRMTGPGRAPSTPSAPGAPMGTAMAPAAPRIEPTFEAPPPAVPAAPAVAEVPPLIPTVVTPVVAEVADQEIGSLVKQAAGTGFGSAGARDRLADLAQVNVAAKEAADRLGIQLPADVFSDNPQVRAAAGLTRSVAGGEAEAAWRNTVTQAVDKADDVIKQFDATFVEGAVAPGVVSQKIKDSLTKTRSDLNTAAGKIYNAVDEVVPKTSIVEMPKLKATLDSVKSEVGETGMSAAERNLSKMIDEGNITYGRLQREKGLIGKALNKMESPYGSMAEADLKRLYAALADDQLTNVGKIGGEELRQQLRAANLLYAKERALGNRIVNAFGQDIEGSVANKMRTAITGAAKGDAGEFNRLLKTVPEDLRKETIATALASVTRSARGAEKGAFGFSEFADLYPKLRANPPVYKTIVDTLGKDSADVLRDLFEVSKRVTEARANVLTTGKANQALLQGMQAESMIGKIMESTLSKGALTGAAAMGGPVAAAATSVITSALTQGNKDSLKAAGKLFADEGFQKLAIEAATKGTPSAASIRRTVMSQSFQKFADAAKLPKALDARIQWLQTAAQAERQADQENQ
ncbi:hypothetical protein UFOVP1024_46 [uncultured Caudovirales phage]|uniref:Uncharacterized protein n=1 Tax=uncultured Caudovirales phage TaxID=2100421 RepID=A0A6J5PVL2_9CAUD|nr:hypothetical protein UFOVP949_25 [uncultured Caudovirales phage]CAB4179189.1 hypothetical protein UFOVP1024_46 [uncultured Caudovirales phage]